MKAKSAEKDKIENDHKRGFSDTKYTYFFYSLGQNHQSDDRNEQNF